MTQKYRSKEFKELDDTSKSIYKAYILGRGYKWFGFLNKLEESDNIMDYNRKEMVAAMLTGRTSKGIVRTKSDHDRAIELATELNGIEYG